MKPAKHLTEILKKHSGRDSTGQISVRHQGGRHKRYYRFIDFKRDKFDVSGTVQTVEYDPNRNARISLVKYSDGETRYILQPRDLKVGDVVISSDTAEIKVGNTVSLQNIPIGTEVHNIELRPGQGGKMVRGAGTAAVVMGKDENYVQIKLPSGAVRLFPKTARATIGVVGNIEHKDIILGTAGRKIRMGIRPTVRGVAQNPRSHPHGGGEGKSGEGMHPKTPWGKSARGTRTRKKYKWSNRYIVKRRSL